MSVILYHVGLTAVPGGYVGVDVFFVISGFLITRLIAGEIATSGTFDFSRFYVRRIRRLLPALLATLVVTFVLSALILSHEKFESFGESLIAAVFSVSNILFWSESGYFDAASSTKPLLHTWSLSVEEQFYLVWPALMWLLAVVLGWRRRAVVGMLALLGIASLALNLVWVTGNFDADFRASIFFLMPFRVFEFVIGALGVFALSSLPDRIWLNEALMASGLGLIIYSVATFTDGLIFPFYAVLLPCLGAILVILGGKSRYAGALVSNRLAVGIGLISYSLYLVHWPIIVAYRSATFADIGVIEGLSLLAVMFAAATLMHNFVERPFRLGAPHGTAPVPQARFLAAIAASVLFIAGLGAHVDATSGWTWRDPKALAGGDIRKGKALRFQLTSGVTCNVAQLANPQRCRMERPLQVLVMGNSHEPDGYNAFAAAYGADPDINLISLGTFNRCDAYIRNGRAVSDRDWQGCRARIGKLTDPAFVSGLDVVVYSSNKPFESNKETEWGILALMRGLNPKLHFVVLGGFFNTTHDCTELYYTEGSFAACRNPKFVNYMPQNERETTRIAAARALDYLYIDKFALLCPGGDLRSCKTEANGEPVFYDQHHLSFGFASYFGTRMAEYYAAELAKIGFPAPAVAAHSPSHPHAQHAADVAGMREMGR